jgi:hypothetical protein
MFSQIKFSQVVGPSSTIINHLGTNMFVSLKEMYEYTEVYGVPFIINIREVRFGNLNTEMYGTVYNANPYMTNIRWYVQTKYTGIFLLSLHLTKIWNFNDKSVYF